jgi:hypothetical protein
MDLILYADLLPSIPVAPLAEDDPMMKVYGPDKTSRRRFILFTWGAAGLLVVAVILLWASVQQKPPGAEACKDADECQLITKSLALLRLEVTGPVFLDETRDVIRFPVQLSSFTLDETAVVKAEFSDRKELIFSPKSPETGRVLQMLTFDLAIPVEATEQKVLLTAEANGHSVSKDLFLVIMPIVQINDVQAQTRLDLQNPEGQLIANVHGRVLPENAKSYWEFKLRNGDTEQEPQTCLVLHGECRLHTTGGLDCIDLEARLVAETALGRVSTAVYMNDCGTT